MSSNKFAKTAGETLLMAGLRSGVSVFGLLFCCLSMAGCREMSNDSGRVSLTGRITYDGQPVPYGDLVFTPDGAQGNSGPEGFALIKNGVYSTRDDRGKGVGRGPMIVAVSAFRDGPGQGIIVETEFKVELPASGGEFDLVIPKVVTAEIPEINF